MLSFSAIFGLCSFGAMLLFVSAILRQLGASEVAKGLVVFTGIAIIAAFAITYLPALLLP
ncbi:MAG: hypothetical protein AAFY22_09955 [Pseudomonadota bacterium]